MLAIYVFTDNSMGQNRYKYVITALLYSVSKSTYIVVIDQQYLEADHIQMGVWFYPCSNRIC